MAQMKLNFRIHLTQRLLPELIHDMGPLFHRWLPDGRNDAIILSESGEQQQLSVWFERRTVMRHGFLKWNREGNEFEPAVMRRQSKIDAGPLFGEVLAVVSEAELAAITQAPVKIGQTYGDHDPASQEYIEAGRRISSNIQQRIGNFVTRLRCQYGQYWLEEIRPWDSRTMTLGTYCDSVLGMTWWCSEISSWCRFIPTPLGSTISAPRMLGRGYGEYLTEADWRALQGDQPLVDVGLGIRLLGAATEALDTGGWSYAFITVITALEISLAQRVMQGTSHPKVRAALNSFDDHETLPARAAVVLLSTGASVDEVASVLSAIRVRNAIAHDGFQPQETDTVELRSVMQSIRRLMQISELKTPILTNGNRLDGPPAGDST